jgi:hypothetical protein
MPLAQIYTLRDGLITHIDLFTQPEDALKAVGLAK